MATRVSRLAAGLVVVLAGACGGSGGGGGGGGSSTGPQELFVLDGSNSLWRYAPGAPGAVLGSVPVTGLLPGELLVGIDTNPANGTLYGLAVSASGTGTAARLLVVDPLTGVATPVGPGLTVPAGASDAGYGFDLNWATDRIRVVNSADANFRVNPSTGLLTVADTPLNPAGQQIDSLAYDQSVPGLPALNRTPFVIRALTGTLLTLGGPGGHPSPNTGTLTPVGPLNTPIDPGGSVALDVFGTNEAYAIFDGNTGPAVVNGLYTVDLTTGQATLVGPLAGAPVLGAFGMALR